MEGLQEEMTRWYDYVAAFGFANFIAISFFNVPALGALMAWGAYEVWMQVYCQYRLKQENDRWR